MLVLVDKLNMTLKQPAHLVPQANVSPTAGAVNPKLPHELRERIPQNQHAGLSAHRFGRDPGQQEARKVAEGQFIGYCQIK